MSESQTQPTPLIRHWRSLVLVPILAMAFFVAYIPHRDYAYPIHFDEWQVMAFTNELVEAGSTARLTNAAYDANWLIQNQVGELGTHVFWGTFEEITGIDWLAIFRYFPGVVYVFSVLGIYVLCNRQGFGWQAAFFAALLPTTVGLLGPAFLVPIALAMVFVPLALFAAFHLRGWWSYPLLSVLVVAPAAIHPPTAAVLVVVLVPFILFSLKGNAGRSLGMALAVVIPFAALFPVIYRIAVPMVKGLLTPQPIRPVVSLPALIPTLGVVTVLLCLVGITSLSWKGRKEGYVLVSGTLALLAMLAVFFSLHYGTEIVYYRGLNVAMMMMSMLAGAGVGSLQIPMTKLQAPNKSQTPNSKSKGGTGAGVGDQIPMTKLQAPNNRPWQLAGAEEDENGADSHASRRSFDRLRMSVLRRAQDERPSTDPSLRSGLKAHQDERPSTDPSLRSGLKAPQDERPSTDPSLRSGLKAHQDERPSTDPSLRSGLKAHQDERARQDGAVPTAQNGLFGSEFQARNPERETGYWRLAAGGWRLAGPVAALVLIGATLGTVIPERLSTPYYHMIDAEDYRAFTWIRANLGDYYRKALLDPWKGMAFVGLSGKRVFSLIGEAPKPRDQQAYDFLHSGCKDNGLLKKEGITIVYTRGAVDNTRLIEVKRGVYVQRPGI